MAHYGYYYYKATYITHPIRDLKRWFRYLKSDIKRFLKKYNIIKPKVMTTQELQDEVVQLRSIGAFKNTVLHRLSQYNNHDGTNIFTAREPGLDVLKEPSVN